MTGDSQRVIAEADHYRILADGTMQATYRDEWVNPECWQQSQDLAALLADAVRREKEDVTELVTDLGRATSTAERVLLDGIEGLCERIEHLEAAMDTPVKMVSALAERVEAVEGQMRERVNGANLIQCKVLDLLNRVAKVTERIEAVEKAIYNTRLDIGEMGLVTESQERNILRKVDALDEQAAAMEQRLDLEAREVDLETERRVEEDNALADRVAALERWKVALSSAGVSTEKRVAALETGAEKRRGASNKRIDWANYLHDKLAVRVAEIDKRLSTSVHDLDLWCEENIEHINRRLDALEAGIGRIDSALEARQQDEAGEGTESDLPSSSEYQRMGDALLRANARRELAREIVERLRDMEEDRSMRDLQQNELKWKGLRLGSAADWIEREYCGEEGEA